jgi:hypothetical protein
LSSRGPNRAAGRERELPAGWAALGWRCYTDRSTVFASQLSGKEGEPPVEPAAPRLAILIAALAALLLIAAPAVAAPGPDPAPHHGSGPQPEPSGGRSPTAAPAAVVRVVTPRPEVGSAPAQPARKARPPAHRKADRRRVVHHSPAAAAQHSAPSAVFNSLRTAAQVPVRQDTARGIDGQKLALAAAALLVLVALAGSLLLLATNEARTPRSP